MKQSNTFLCNHAFCTENKGIANKTISNDFASLSNLKGIYLSKSDTILKIHHIKSLSLSFLIDALL